MITRFITSSLIETLDYFPVAGIIGPRQVGKTTTWNLKTNIGELIILLKWLSFIEKTWLRIIDR